MKKAIIDLDKPIQFLKFITLIGCISLSSFQLPAQNTAVNGEGKNSDSKTISQKKYRNVFLESGYSQSDIDSKVAKAYHDLFEGPNKVYFEVGDSMGYVSDIKTRMLEPKGYPTV